MYGALVRKIEKVLTLRENERATVPVMIRKVREVLELDPEIKVLLDTVNFEECWQEVNIGMRLDPGFDNVIVTTSLGGKSGTYTEVYFDEYDEQIVGMLQMRFLKVTTRRTGYSAFMDMSRVAAAIRYWGNRFLRINYRKIAEF